MTFFSVAEACGVLLFNLIYNKINLKYGIKLGHIFSEIVLVTWLF